MKRRSRQLPQPFKWPKAPQFIASDNGPLLSRALPPYRPVMRGELERLAAAKFAVLRQLGIAIRPSDWPAV